MKQRYYAANEGEALLKLTTTLGKDFITIEVADKNLNWNRIVLNEKQSKGFKDFMRENDI